MQLLVMRRSSSAPNVLHAPALTLPWSLQNASVSSQLLCWKDTPETGSKMSYLQRPDGHKDLRVS
jgi:hypothetical protein